MSAVLENLDVFVEGMRTTLALTLVAFAVAFAIGLVIAAFRVSPVPPLRWVGTLYVETVRNTPLPVLFFLFYFGLPKVGFLFSPFTTAVIVLGGYTGAFLGETIRSGINTVAKGQAEAARALGLTFPEVLRVIVLPQALRSVVAPIGNLFIALTKNSSIASTISLIELTYVANQLNTETARPIPVFLAAGVAYLALTLPSGFIFGAIERRVAIVR